jgi:5'-methylthioinosine phosphorylase
VGTIAGKRVAFLARHGEGHACRRTASTTAPTSRAAGRAHARAGAQHGRRHHRRFGPRVLACPDQLIDYTWGRISTLCEEPGTEVLHVDFGDPYTPACGAGPRCAQRRAGSPSSMAVATAPPRARAWRRRRRSRRMRRDGCDLVGMTGMPEGRLARELGLDYACLASSPTGPARCGDDAKITLADVLANVDRFTADRLRCCAAAGVRLDGCCQPPPYAYSARARSPPPGARTYASSTRSHRLCSTAP